MWGIVPAAGAGSRIQPLAFSQGAAARGQPRGGRQSSDRAPSASTWSSACSSVARQNDLLRHVARASRTSWSTTARASRDAIVCYAVQPRPAGLCDAMFRAGTADRRRRPSCWWGCRTPCGSRPTGFRRLPDGVLSFLLFPVERPEVFDAVVTDFEGGVVAIQVKQPQARTHWVWGAFQMPGSTYHARAAGLWLERGRRDEYFGTLVNALLERGGRAAACAPARCTWTSGRCTAIARRFRRWRGARPAQRRRKGVRHDRPSADGHERGGSAARAPAPAATGRVRRGVVRRQLR